jgi:hypothetical protein
LGGPRVHSGAHAHAPAQHLLPGHELDAVLGRRFGWRGGSRPRPERRAASRNVRAIASISSNQGACGVGCAGANGTDEAFGFCSPCVSSERPRPSRALAVKAMRPACAGRSAGAAPCAGTMRKKPARGWACSSLARPRLLRLMCALAPNADAPRHKAGPARRRSARPGAQLVVPSDGEPQGSSPTTMRSRSVRSRGSKVATGVRPSRLIANAV